MIGINSWKNLRVKHFKTFRKVDLFESFFFSNRMFQKSITFFSKISCHSKTILQSLISHKNYYSRKVTQFPCIYRKRELLPSSLWCCFPVFHFCFNNCQTLSCPFKEKVNLVELNEVFAEESKWFNFSSNPLVLFLLLALM